MENNRLISNSSAGMNAVSNTESTGGSILEDPYRMNVTVIARGVNRGEAGPYISNSNSNDDDNHTPITQLELNLVGYLLMSCFLLILSIILGLIVYSILRRRHLLFSSLLGFGEDQGSNGSHGTPSRNMLLRIQRRYETIEHWIISKKVQPHDDFCDKVVTNFGHHHHPPPPPSSPVSAVDAHDHDGDDDNNNNTITATATATSENDQCCLNCQPPLESDHEQRECPICMSALTRGQIVSWSANEKCSHVYHHQCIKEWLLRHIDCCLCKNTFLPVDMKKGPAKEAALQELSCDYAAASATSYYCVKTGLIRIPRSVRCTKTELHLLEQRIFEGTVPPVTLASMRGSREASTSRNDDGMLVMVVPMAATTTGFRANSTMTTNTTTTTGTILDDAQFEEQELSFSSSSSSSSTTTTTTIAPRSVDQHDDPVGANTTSSLPPAMVLHEHEPPQQQHQQHRPPNDQDQSFSSRDVELGGNQELLLTASYHLVLEKSRIGDNRCCILHDSSDDSVEVKETSSSGHIREEEELSDHHDMVERFHREDTF